MMSFDHILNDNRSQENVMKVIFRKGEHLQSHQTGICLRGFKIHLIGHIHSDVWTFLCWDITLGKSLGGI